MKKNYVSQEVYLEYTKYLDHKVLRKINLKEIRSQEKKIESRQNLLNYLHKHGFDKVEQQFIETSKNIDQCSSLKFNEEKLNIEQATKLAAIIANDITLKSLLLINCKIAPGGLEALVTAFAKNSTITYISICNIKIDEKSIEALKKIFKNNKAIKTIDLRDDQINHEQAKSLLESAKNNSNIEEINLLNNEFNKVDSENLQALKQYAKNNHIPAIFSFNDYNSSLINSCIYMGENDYIKDYTLALNGDSNSIKF